MRVYTVHHEGNLDLVTRDLDEAVTWAINHLQDDYGTEFCSAIDICYVDDLQLRHRDPFGTKGTSPNVDKAGRSLEFNDRGVVEFRPHGLPLTEAGVTIMRHDV